MIRRFETTSCQDFNPKGFKLLSAVLGKKSQFLNLLQAISKIVDYAQESRLPAGFHICFYKN
jgi:hypothetical protein